MCNYADKKVMFIYMHILRYIEKCKHLFPMERYYLLYHIIFSNIFIIALYQNGQHRKLNQISYIILHTITKQIMGIFIYLSIDTLFSI